MSVIAHLKPAGEFKDAMGVDRTLPSITGPARVTAKNA
jgi:hypothetical protein